jgi:hypothetical protein
LKPKLALFKRRYILTGSPNPKNYEDLFGQIYILDRGVTLGSFITHYRNTYFYLTGFEMREWKLLTGSAERINAAIAPMVVRVDARDHLKLPGTPDRLHRVKLPLAAQREYDAVEDSLMSVLFDQPLQNAAAARAKCSQIANGAVYLDFDPEERGPRPYKVVHEAKLDALQDLYDELQGEPLLVGIGYHHDVAQIRKRLGAAVPCLNSETTPRRWKELLAAWNGGELPLLLGHPASMGHALNMQKSNGRHVAFFWIPDNYDDCDQMFRRVWRQGNKAPFCMRHHFVAQDTVDEAKLRNLERKGNGQRDFLAAMRAYTDLKYNKGRRKSR